MAYSKSKLGEIIGGIRTKRGLTQQQLAEKVGVTRNFIGLVETGARGVGIDHLRSIATHIGVPMTFLIALAEAPEAEEKNAALLKSFRTAIRDLIDAQLGLPGVAKKNRSL